MQSHNKIRCFTCSEIRHQSKFCSRNSGVVIRLSEIDEENKKKFVISVFVNGKKLIGYRDSGANLTCIKRSILHQLDLKSNEVVNHTLYHNCIYHIILKTVLWIRVNIKRIV